MTDFDIIKSIVDMGISRMKFNLTEQELNAWTDYARNMLRVTLSPSMLTIENGFLQVLISLIPQSLSPYQKLNIYIKYFLEVMKRGNPYVLY